MPLNRPMGFSIKLPTDLSIPGASNQHVEGSSRKPKLKLSLNFDCIPTRSGANISKNKIKLHFQDCTLCHGSRSASLLAFTSLQKEAKCRLLPTGQLMKLGYVPFSGECGNALTKKSLNRDHLSAVDIEGFSVAYDYANSLHGKKWTLSDEFSAMHEHKMELSRTEGTEYSSFEQLAQAKLDLSKKRVEQWSRMTPMEQDLVTKNFPVLYGFKTAPLEQRPDGIKLVPSDILEYGIEGGVKADQILKVMVPSEHVEYTQALLASNPETLHIKVISNKAIEADQ